MAGIDPRTIDQGRQDDPQKTALSIQVLVGSVLALPKDKRDAAIAAIFQEIKIKVEKGRAEPHTRLSNES